MFEYRIKLTNTRMVIDPTTFMPVSKTRPRFNITADEYDVYTNWLNEFCVGEWRWAETVWPDHKYVTSGTILFELENDLLYFKLVWS